MTVTVLHAGLLTTIQDLGRYGAQKYGVIVSGAMDSYSLRIANILVGNDEGEGAIEVTLFGTSLQFEKDQLIAITGADLAANLDGEKAPMWRPVLVRKGSILTFKSGKKGARAYIAFAGGIAIPQAMGSKSTYLRAGIGGFQGRALQKGDTFDCGEMNAIGRSFFHQLKAMDEHFTWSVNYKALINFQQTQTIRVLEGTEFNRFDEKSKQLLFEKPYIVTTQADRMGYRLEGTAPLSLTNQFELLSEGVTYGTIQVPSNGQPIILMVDRQTTGGYPKIAQVISADLPSLAQLQPMATIQFKKVSLQEAQTVFMKNERLIEDIKRGIQLKEKK
jgi:antagonist of KipI